MKQNNFKRLWLEKERSEDKIRLQSQHRKVSNLIYLSGQKNEESRNRLSKNPISIQKNLEKMEIDYRNLINQNEKLQENIANSSDFRGLINIDFNDDVQRLGMPSKKFRKRLNNDFKSLPIAKSYYCEKYSLKNDNYKDIEYKRKGEYGLNHVSSHSQNPLEQKELIQSIELINEFERNQKKFSSNKSFIVSSKKNDKEESTIPIKKY